MSLAIEPSLATNVDRQTLTRQIAALVARLHPHVALDRRGDDRIAIPVLFRLTPLDAHHQPIRYLSSIVVGKNISRRGVSFFHETPIPHRRALIELAHPEFGRFAAEVDLNWCRFTRPGWYESGGRLVRSLPQSLPSASVSPGLLVPVTAAATAIDQSETGSECSL